MGRANRIEQSALWSNRVEQLEQWFFVPELGCYKHIPTLVWGNYWRLSILCLSLIFLQDKTVSSNSLCFTKAWITVKVRLSKQHLVNYHIPGMYKKVMKKVNKKGRNKISHALIMCLYQTSQLKTSCQSNQARNARRFEFLLSLVLLLWVITYTKQTTIFYKFKS